jgi:uncharacterized membrane protein
MLVLKRYLISIVVFVLVDFTWINVVANEFYKQHIGDLLREQFLLGPAVLFYLLFLTGVMLFVIHPRANDRYATICGYAMAFGMVTYATFDLTCLALFKGFPVIVAVVDIMWGGVLCTAVSVGTIFVSRRMGLGEAGD